LRLHFLKEGHYLLNSYTGPNLSGVSVALTKYQRTSYRNACGPQPPSAAKRRPRKKGDFLRIRKLNGLKHPTQEPKTKSQRLIAKCYLLVFVAQALLPVIWLSVLMFFKSCGPQPPSAAKRRLRKKARLFKNYETEGTLNIQPKSPRANC
jgi:hypothetical protein